jgi:DNA-binding transcriptional LysR family regulator
MGPRQLKSFIALAEELHFGRAAKRVNLSQPALSLQVQAIEEELEVKLFLRNRRRTELTQAGEVFLAEAKEILLRTEQAISTVQRAALGQVGSLKIGFISTAAAIITPKLVKQFREKYAQVKIELRNVLTRDQLTQLQERKIDVGFLRMPLAIPADISTRVIHREPFVLLLPADHPLAHIKGLKLSDCEGADFVMYTRKMAPGFHDQILNILHKNGVTPNVVLQASEMYTLISLVATGLGIAIAPASITLHVVDNVVVRQLPAGEARSEIAIAWKKDYVSPTTQLFLKMTLTDARKRKITTEKS